MREIILIPAVGALIELMLRRNPFIVRVAMRLFDLILLSFSKGEGRCYKSLMITTNNSFSILRVPSNFEEYQKKKSPTSQGCALFLSFGEAR
jgi:hypothetical protein